MNNSSTVSQSPANKERVENSFPFSVARDSVASAWSGLTTRSVVPQWGLTTRRGCEFLVGWNERRAVPAEDMSITIRIAGTAQRLFQPTAGELKNSQTGSVVPQWGNYFRNVPDWTAPVCGETLTRSTSEGPIPNRRHVVPRWRFGLVIQERYNFKDRQRTTDPESVCVSVASSWYVWRFSQSGAVQLSVCDLASRPDALFKSPRRDCTRCEPRPAAPPRFYC